MRYIAISIASLVLLCGCDLISRTESNLNDQEREIDQFSLEYNTMEEAEAKLIQVLSSRYGVPGESVLEPAYYPELINFIENEPRSIDYPFEELQAKNFISVVTSEDGALRLYYWDTYQPGNEIKFRDVCQYRSGEKVYCVTDSILGASSDDEGYIAGVAILGIETIYDKNLNPIYMVNYYDRCGSNFGCTGVKLVKIEDGKLREVPIFVGGPNASEEANDSERIVIHRNSSWDSCTSGEGWDWLFRYDHTTSLLYVPMCVMHYNDLSDRYAIYRFDGEEFTFVGVDGGYWLHPTIRSFEELAWTFKTKDYRIRIDRMFDNTYRYAAWNNRRGMDKKPDIVIYGGVRSTYGDDNMQPRFLFRSNNYEYIVDDSGLKVQRDGKRILEQKVQPTY